MDHRRLVAAALEAQQIAEAIALARAALEAGVEDSLFLNLRAFWLEGQARYDEALADLERARTLDPDNVPALNALGLALGRVGRMVEALEAFDRVVALAPDFPPGHFNHGWASEQAGLLDQAQASYGRAVALQPEMAPPHAHLAALAALRADWAETRACAAKALALDPRQTTATLALARADFGEKAFDAAIARLNALLESEFTQPEDCVAAQMLLGDVYDRLGRHDEAFAAYAAGNALTRALQKNRFARPGVQTMPEYIAMLTDHFAQVPPWPGPAIPVRHDGDPQAHVFVLGFPRSGTTLLEEMLATLPGAVTTQERDGLVAGVRDFMTDADDLAELAAADEARLEPYRETYWRHLAQFGVARRGRIVIDKHPNHTVKLPLIARLFPEAKILFCLRDPRDVVLGCFRQRFEANPTNFEFLTLDGTARLYDRTMALAALYREKLPLTLREARLETLVDDFEAEARSICAFLGCDWTGGMTRFAEHSRQRFVTTPSGVQIAGGLSREGLGRWRNYRRQMEPVLPALAPWALRYGYAAD